MSVSSDDSAELVDLVALALSLDGAREERITAVLEFVRARTLDDIEAVFISQDQFDFEARRLRLGEPHGAVRADIDPSIYRVLRDPAFLERMDRAFSTWTDIIVRDNGKDQGMWTCETAAGAGVDVTEWRRDQLHPAGLEDVWGATACYAEGSFLSVILPLHCGRPRPTSEQLRFVLRLPHVLAPLLIPKGPPSTPQKVGEAVEEGLSEAEARVYGLALNGLTDKQIALRLHRSQHTVNSHLRAIYRHFKVSSRAQLLAQAIESDLRSR